MSEEGGSGLNIGFNPQAESPYRKETTKEVTEEVNEQRNFEVCQPKESVIKKGFIRKNRTKRTIVHLKDEDGERKWSVLIIPPDGEPEHYQFDA